MLVNIQKCMHCNVGNAYVFLDCFLSFIISAFLLFIFCHIISGVSNLLLLCFILFFAFSNNIFIYISFAGQISCTIDSCREANGKGCLYCIQAGGKNLFSSKSLRRFVFIPTKSQIHFVFFFSKNINVFVNPLSKVKHTKKDNADMPYACMHTHTHTHTLASQVASYLVLLHGLHNHLGYLQWWLPYLGLGWLQFYGLSTYVIPGSGFTRVEHGTFTFEYFSMKLKTVYSRKEISVHYR